MSRFTIWLRDEDRETERRTPLLPSGAKQLIDIGYNVVVERSAKRIFPDSDYEAAGCTMAASGSWVNAPADFTILGLKELPHAPAVLKNNHIYFAHAFKQQNGWQELLGRFQSGGGKLLDIEYMVDGNGRRVVAFGYWAGYMGAALALMQWYDKTAGRKGLNATGLSPWDNAGLLDEDIRARKADGPSPKVLVIGARGRSGKGACELLARHGVEVTCWGRDETRELDRDALLAHDILINCVFVDNAIPPFVRLEDLARNQRLSVISDVSCDPFSDFNPLPLYAAPTSWDHPVVRAGVNGGAIDLIAIDNLPSLLPREASEEFAGLLLPYLKAVDKLDANPVWRAALGAYESACDSLSA
ncbi:saccharopine dehydrogenase [Emcibacter nanhaiensis]|uniref:Saccharopine dehydrogenase [NAD(+), L-lysine-forming] n=1 Tax=Emcibacter nanhaiensis TaxID=1505037 RepID=A0A501PBB8_9PROT|nr:saccharopine dehydrogenase [Emcibacter nanhaiensis]TPD57699.1 saccharopine dehydrogenase [Emcibacter nanhaiensis]